MRRKEIYGLIKKQGLQDSIKQEHKVNYTNLSNGILESWVSNKSLIHLTEAGTRKPISIKATDMSSIMGYDEKGFISLWREIPEGTNTIVVSKGGVHYVTEDSNKVYDEVKRMMG